MLGKVVEMQSTPTSAPRRRTAAHSLLSALRGDQHMIGAYPQTRDGALDGRFAGLVPAGAPRRSDPDTERWIDEGGSDAAAARG